MDHDPFIEPAEAADMAGLTTAALAQLRYRGGGPRFYKPTPRKVLYKRAEVIDWIEKTAHVATHVPA